MGFRIPQMAWGPLGGPMLGNDAGLRIPQMAWGPLGGPMIGNTGGFNVPQMAWGLPAAQVAQNDEPAGLDKQLRRFPKKPWVAQFTPNPNSGGGALQQILRGRKEEGIA